ncbi:hypothetical protein DL96DRAFT_1713105 [Flagelloscypha sp. PMI_526]|nr:hypothetical protein DL96DRAFT_1713105 [Flagelloscypha sp. PMI_526]
MSTTPGLSVDFVGDSIFHVFQVEDTLFRLPAQHFSLHAQFFQTVLSLPDKAPSTDDNPIQIYDTSVETFVAVLEWLYRLPLSLRLNKDAWIKIFRFAQAYQMELLQKEALDKMTTFAWSPIERISFCERYSIDLTWAASSLAILAARWKPLTAEEERSIESQTFGLIMKLREAAREAGWSQDVQGTRRTTNYIFNSYPGPPPPKRSSQWPPVLKFTATDVAKYLERTGGGRSLSSRSNTSLEAETGLYSSNSSEDFVAEAQATRFLRRHDRFYLSDEPLQLSNEEVALQVHLGVLGLHNSSLNATSLRPTDELFLSQTAIRCLRWIYRETEISSSTVEEWTSILQFSHRASFSHLK